MLSDPRLASGPCNAQSSDLKARSCAVLSVTAKCLGYRRVWVSQSNESVLEEKCLESKRVFKEQIKVGYDGIKFFTSCCRFH